MQSFRQLLNYRVLTEAYRARPTLRTYGLTQTFFTSPKDVDGDEYEFIYYPAMNEPAPMNTRGNEARIIGAEGGSQKKAALFYAFNKTPVPMAGLEALREENSEQLQEKGRSVISTIFDQFKERHAIYKELVIAKALTSGVIYADANGRILESSSGAVITADLGVASTHKTNLDGIISALWSVDTTKIPAQLEAIADRCESEGSEKPTEIYLHPLAKKFLRANTEFQLWAKESNQAPDTILRGEMIEGLWGFNWHFYGAKYKAADGSTKDFIPKEKGIICPKPGGWLKCANGSTLVPKQFGVMESIDQALANCAKVYGQFSYAKLIDDPIMLLMYLGESFGFNFADPNAVNMPTLFSF